MQPSIQNGAYGTKTVGGNVPIATLIKNFFVGNRRILLLALIANEGLLMLTLIATVSNHARINCKRAHFICE